MPPENVRSWLTEMGVLAAPPGGVCAVRNFLQRRPGVALSGHACHPRNDPCYPEGRAPRHSSHSRQIGRAPQGHRPCQQRPCQYRQKGCRGNRTGTRKGPTLLVNLTSYGRLIAGAYRCGSSTLTCSLLRCNRSFVLTYDGEVDMFSGYIFDVEGTLVDSVPQNLSSLSPGQAGFDIPYATPQLYSGLDGDQTLQGPCCIPAQADLAGN